jgi:hypothetical protein
LHLAVAVFVFAKHPIQENPYEAYAEDNQFGLRGTAARSNGAG